MLTLREAKPNEGMAKLASGEKKRFGHRRHFPLRDLFRTFRLSVGNTTTG
jgi:hypothetical protein